MPYKSAHCMVVEDNDAFRAAAELMLRNIGFKHITSFVDAESAWRQLNECRFDIVLSDWNMEPLCGIELLHRVRATPYLCELKFVLMSASNDCCKEAFEIGAAAFLQKPFTIKMLRDTFQILLTPAQYCSPNAGAVSAAAPSDLLAW